MERADLDRYCDNLEDVFNRIESGINIKGKQKFIYGDGDKEKNITLFNQYILEGLEI